MSSRPQRKRARVSYYEPDPEPEDDVIEHAATEAVTTEDEEDPDDDSDDDFSLRKKPKSKGSKKAKKTKASKKKKKIKDVPFPFMSLPPEIRNMIYDMLLVDPSKKLNIITKQNMKTIVPGQMVKLAPYSGGWYRQNTSRWKRGAQKNRFYPVILRVSRSITDEALPLFYAQTLRFEHAIALHKFLAFIGPANRLLLRNIVIGGWRENEWPSWTEALLPAFAMLTSATNIKRISLDRRVISADDGACHMRWSRNAVPTKEDYDRTFARCATTIRPLIDFWIQTVDAANGKGSAKAILQFDDINFGSQKEIDEGDDAVKERREYFMDQLKLE